MLFQGPEDYRQQKRTLAKKTTDDLLAMWRQSDTNLGKRLIVHQSLLERGVDIPFLKIEDEADERRFPVASNTTLRVHQSGKLEFRFPSDGFMTHGRFQFCNNDEFLDYCAEALGFRNRQAVTHGKVTRKGKYQRVDAGGNPIFTFGDPLLDLVTNKYGILVVGEMVYDLKAAMIRSGFRRGGIRSWERPAYLDWFERQGTEAVAGNSGFVVLESGDDVGTLASNNPSFVAFKQGGLSGFCRAWRTDLLVYWSMGAEVEMNVGKFQSAVLIGKYANQVAGPFCAVVGGDFDSDENDDYMDEWEWGIRPCDSMWDGHRSDFQVMIGNVTIGGTVEKLGNCNLII